MRENGNLNGFENTLEKEGETVVFSAAVIYYLVGNLFRTYTVSLAMRIFFHSEKRNKPLAFFAYGCYFAGVSYAFIRIHLPLVSLVANIVLIFALSYVLDRRQRLGMRVFVVLLIAISCVLIDRIVATIMGIHHLPENSFAGVVTIISTLIQFIIVQIGDKFVRTDNSQLMRTRQLLMVTCTPLVSVYLTAVINHTLVDAEPLRLVIIYSGILMMNIVNVSVFHSLTMLMEREKQQALNRLQDDAYRKQYELMKESMDLASSIRHDMKNIICGLQGYLMQQDYDGANQYITKLLGSVGQDHLLKSKTGYAVIDSIINYKCAVAKEAGIQVDVEQEICESVKIEASDLAVILGNLLDNAIEGACGATATGKAISVQIALRQNLFSVKVENPYNGVLRDCLASTKENPAEHGYGLKNVRRIVDKYGGYLDIRHDEKVFICEASMYNEM